VRSRSGITALPMSWNRAARWSVAIRLLSASRSRATDTAYARPVRRARWYPAREQRLPSAAPLVRTLCRLDLRADVLGEIPQLDRQRRVPLHVSSASFASAGRGRREPETIAGDGFTRRSAIDARVRFAVEQRGMCRREDDSRLRVLSMDLGGQPEAVAARMTRSMIARSKCAARSASSASSAFDAVLASRPSERASVTGCLGRRFIVDDEDGGDGRHGAASPGPMRQSAATLTL